MFFLGLGFSLNKSISLFCGIARSKTGSLRIYTQPRFLNHDALAEGLLNHGHNTATGFLQPWKQFLCNTHPFLQLLVVRMQKDFMATAPKMRKPWNSKDLDSWLHILLHGPHSIGKGYQHQNLKNPKSIPNSFFVWNLNSRRPSYKEPVVAS